MQNSVVSVVDLLERTESKIYDASDLLFEALDFLCEVSSLLRSIGVDVEKWNEWQEVMSFWNMAESGLANVQELIPVLIDKVEALGRNDDSES
jgi:hypothetical protein